MLLRVKQAETLIFNLPKVLVTLCNFLRLYPLIMFVIASNYSIKDIGESVNRNNQQCKQLNYSLSDPVNIHTLPTVFFY